MKNSIKILQAWVHLEGALRAALPVCSVRPPTQPSELLSALRINHRIGADEEERILVLREIRNRVASDPKEPSDEEVNRFQEEVSELKSHLGSATDPPC